MKRFLLSATMLGALALGGCNSIDPNVATPNQVLIGINAYNTGVAVGRAYLKLPLCTVASPPCRTQPMSQSVYTALKAGRAAREQLLGNLAANQAASLTALQALSAAYAVIQQIPR